MKTYVKPELYFESFELSQHIAACDLKLNAKTIWDCCVDPIDHTSPLYGSLEGEFAGGFVGDSKVCTKKCEIYCYTNGADFLPKFFQS